MEGKVRHNLGPQLHITPCADLIEQIAPVSNKDARCKPFGGLWTSSYVNGSSAWIEWCEAEEFGDPHGANRFLLYPKADARILVIDSLADLERALSDYGSVCVKSAVMGAPYFSQDRRPDFEEIARHFDAMHLTEEGQEATRFTEPDLYGWDCESTVWFRWAFDRVERIPLPRKALCDAVLSEVEWE
jgi:hypothetical protein